MSLDDRSSPSPNSDRPPVDVWKLKLGSVKAPHCVICGGQTRWGIQVRGVSLCDRHWTLRNRLRSLLGLSLPTDSHLEDFAEEG